MKRLLVIFLLACGVTRTWAGLVHVQALVADLAYTPLSGVLAMMGKDLPAVEPLPGGLAVGGDLPISEPLVPSRWDTASLSVFEPLSSGLALMEKDASQFTAIQLLSRQKADPFMMDNDIEIWSGSPLAALRNAALKADNQGDEAAFRNLEKRYWDGFGAALERRRILGQKTDAGRFDK